MAYRCVVSGKSYRSNVSCIYITVAEMPEHNHTSPIDSFVNTDSQTNVVNGGHISNNSQGTNFATSYAGSSKSHNNIQPSIVTNYIIKAKQSAGLVATVVDSLESTSATNALSAKKGKELSIYGFSMKCFFILCKCIPT